MDLLQGDNYSLFLKNGTYNTDININFNMNFIMKRSGDGVVEKPWRLFKNVQMQGAQ
jgi:hypothetical protein